MAYGKKYTTSFKNKQGNTWTVDFFKRDYTGAVSTINFLDGEEPVIYNRRGDKDDREGIIWGSELIINVVANKGEDYTEIIDSAYKDFKVELRLGSAKKWTGFLKPENITRQWLGEVYAVSLSCTDALAELKDIDFKYNEKMTLLEIVSKALAETGIELPFLVRSNTIEVTPEYPWKPALMYAEVTARRLLKEDNGKIEYSSCYEAIEAVLMPFNCVLFQEDNFYCIINPYEDNSERRAIGFDLSYNEVYPGNPNILHSLENYTFLDQGTLQRLQPVKRVKLTFTNENRGDNLLLNSNFESLDTWQGRNYDNEPFDAFEKREDYLYVARDIYNDGLEPVTRYFIEYTPTLSLTKNAPEDRVRVSFKASLIPYAGRAYKIFIRPALINLVGNIPTLGAQHEISDTDVLFSDDLFFTTGNFRLRLIITSDMDFWAPEWSYLYELLVKSITFEVKYDEPEFERVKIVGVDNPNDGGKDYEQEILFADTKEPTDLGAIFIDGALTKSWRRDKMVENLSLMECYANTMLANNLKYKDSIKVGILDLQNNITNNKIFTIHNKQYLLVAFAKNLKACTIDADLVERLGYVPPVAAPVLSFSPSDFNKHYLYWSMNIQTSQEIGHYEIYRDGVKIAESETQSYTDSAIATGVSYLYKVRAVDVHGVKSGFSMERAVIAQFKAPENLRVVSMTSNSLSVAWNAAQHTRGIAGYNLTVNGVGYALGNQLSMPIPNITPNTTYTIFVRARTSSPLSYSLDSQNLVVTTPA